MTEQRQNYQVFQAVPIPEVCIEDRFWQPRLETNRNVSLFQQYHQLEQSGALRNFQRVIRHTPGEFAGLFFSDSDVYKWLEASSYSLLAHPDRRLESLVDGVIHLIAAAQEQSGYVNTYFQLVEPDKKFTNLGVCHELYTAGHLIQAAVAHRRATGGTALLEVARRMADHIAAVFGPGKLEAVDGHAGIEMALIALYRCTGQHRYFEVARYFIEQRGHPESRIRWELDHLDEIAGRLGRPGQNNRKFFGTVAAYDGRYAQDHLPVRQQSEAVGHAVRGLFLYCGMTDLAAETGDLDLVAALERIWRHLTTRRMYLSGGVGSARANEGFTRDYDLPNDTACAESCAAVAMVLWNHRMLNLQGDGGYGDLMERVLYNAFLAGVSLDGKKYFYNNPLSSSGDYHREEWYECACCPPNIARLFASLAGFIYSQFAGGIAVHLYIQSSSVLALADGTAVKFRQFTDYPWDGKIQCRIETASPVHLEVRLRIPGWCRSYRITINHQLVAVPLQKGYAVIRRQWSPGDLLELDLAMPVERIEAHPGVAQDAGKVALQRGPLLYCLENADNDFPVAQFILAGDSQLTYDFSAGLCGGMTVIEGDGFIPDLSGWEGTLYRTSETVPRYVPVRFRAVPYYCWDNRQPGAMTVWLNAIQ